MTPSYDALLGLSTGDSFGAQFFVPDNRHHLTERQLPPGPWPWTDDTEMACSVHAALSERGGVDTFDLTHAFARRHDFDRGYGPAANRLLRLVREGGDARELAAALFDGQGSYGNGAAMRVAPLGAAYAADPALAVEPATATAVITHTHPQAVAGAVAVAVAAAYAVRARTGPTTPERFLRDVLALTPDGAVRRGIAEAVTLLGEPDHRTAARLLGNGRLVSAADTVPFALWAAARNLGDYPSALWETVSAGGDVDTTAAIVGGVVAAHTGAAGIPAEWLAAAEPLPDWAFPAPGSVAGPRGEAILRPEPVPVPELHWTDRDWQRVRHGLRPRTMEDRWLGFTEEGVLHLRRSWTGHGIFAVRVRPVRGGGWRPESAVAESEPGRFGLPGPGRAELLATLLRGL
ncbi:ADP-ribosylglycohydrolase family protein [Kitasatospora sp. NPDC051853]|uniref:ADP-ribosylglycohydrolase family protein n=1 Tax=Kitasatospora sp. NPDC051853 TaxID=3364058 RepID=UPI0037B9B5AD